MDESEITRFLIATVQQRRTILGSQLGAAVSAAFPEIRGDPEYPGLKRFIQSHCQGRIVKISDHFGADVYKFIPEGETAPAAETSVETPEAWNVFQHPAANGELFVNPKSGELLVLIDPVGHSDGLAWIPKVTREEHHRIAQEFLENIEESDRWEFQQALESESYWPHWSKLVNRSRYKREWTAFRFGKLCDLFKVRLSGHGLNDALVSSALGHLLREKKGRSERIGESNGGEHTAKETHLCLEGLASLRAMIHVAIDSMSENELRRLWLPLGDVLDAFNRSRR